MVPPLTACRLGWCRRLVNFDQSRTVVLIAAYDFSSVSPRGERQEHGRVLARGRESERPCSGKGLRQNVTNWDCPQSSLDAISAPVLS